MGVLGRIKIKIGVELRIGDGINDADIENIMGCIGIRLKTEVDEEPRVVFVKGFTINHVGKLIAVNDVVDVRGSFPNESLRVHVITEDVIGRNPVDEVPSVGGSNPRIGVRAVNGIVKNLRISRWR